MNNLWRLEENFDIKENFDIDEGLGKELDDGLPEDPSSNTINQDENSDPVTSDELMQLKELALGLSEIGTEDESSMNYEIPDISDLTPIDSADELSIDYEMPDISDIKPIDEDWYLYKEVEQKGRKR